MSRRSVPYKVCAIYDTETCNLIDGKNSRAYTILYQINDLRNVDIACYEPETSDDIRLFRHEVEVIDYIAELVAWGRDNACVPVVCAYNLLFDLRSLIFDLRIRYEMRVNAQSGTSVYTLDLMDGERCLLRFWDCFYLDMRGLAAMGEVAGLPKADGDWDYTLIRTQDTPLTEQELHYAARDVQVIPAYLAWLCRANAWLTPDMLGRSVLTKTSLVRQMARAQIAPLRYGPKSKATVGGCFYRLCHQNLSSSFASYALRKACFRGGLTFTAARMASVLTRNVASLDVTSMHHTFMAAAVPVNFGMSDSATLQHVCEGIVRTDVGHVLTHYYRPFDFGIHAKIRFRHLRLREGSAFARWAIATLARAKVGARMETVDDLTMRNDATRIQDETLRRGGWHDSVSGVEVAFGKIYAADVADVFVNEIELYVMSLVYEWDSMTCVLGEMTCNFVHPPAYVGLQSMQLFELKSIMKHIVNTYVEGKPYAEEISPLVPEGIAAGLRTGTVDTQFLTSYYTSTIKGMFNGIYGTQAQDVYKPDYTVLLDGSIVVDTDKVCTEDTFAKRQPRTSKVLYTYGMRIVGRSRLHLALAIMMLDGALGERVDVCGGDTDSLKVRCDADVMDGDLLAALKPLHDAADLCLREGYRDMRRTWPELCSDMSDVGHFDVERCGRGTRYPYHMELWNKCRMSIDSDLKAHVTAAGLSRPKGEYTIVDYINDRIREHIDKDDCPGDALYDALGYNVYVDNDVAHALERTNPRCTTRVCERVIDYLGGVYDVDLPAVMALYPVGRDFGSLLTATANENLHYLKIHYQRYPRCDYRVISKDDRL